MVTTVGTSGDYRTLLTNFILLEHDAIAAYEATIRRLHDADLADQVEAFLGDHKRHLRELHSMAERAGAESPKEGDAKQLLTAGKVKIAAMMDGDGTVLRAMATNEADTVRAYESAVSNEAVPEQARGFFEACLKDEHGHKGWMEEAARSA